ncbi:response regulator transcription factor [Flavobacterium lacisediminis]|uniref:Response regulator transcription factor n=1 Tax=Flavobacterium lacisediminis TaxID=2989705 RepID=A0ABT3EG51_9FLAO|nr:response regulator transcription factor [Flavobacterium lacisediminis]MCW1147552.1 response regulator transcription factor [Flavobacterium lacisediminis]
MNIFIAEDHQMTIEGYKMILSFSSILGDNINYIEANSCEEAYLKINNALKLNTKIDLAIIDYSMPIYRQENIFNGADVCKYLKKIFPNCKIIILTASIDNITLFDIVQNVSPDGIATKMDVSGVVFLEIIETVLSGKKFRSSYVVEQLEEIWENEVFINEKNRLILQYLSLGFKINEIASELSVSEITIKKRISKIRQSFNLNEDENIVKEAKSRGYI